MNEFDPTKPIILPSLYFPDYQVQAAPILTAPVQTYPKIITNSPDAPQVFTRASVGGRAAAKMP